MRRHSSVAACIAVALVAGGASRAQMMGMTRGMSGLMLLNIKEVQKELKLKADQMKRLQEKEKAMGDIGKSKDAAAMANAMAMTSSTDMMEKWASDVLDADQAKRFHELLLQHNGPTMLGEPSVSKELDLTSEQKSWVSGILDKADADAQAAMMGMRNVHSNGAVKDFKKKMDAMKKATNESLMAVLSPEQSSKWETMQGAKFKFPKGMDMPF